MYFKRKIDDFLVQWKKDPYHKPLIVKGARQIGKTELSVYKSFIKKIIPRWKKIFLSDPETN